MFGFPFLCAVKEMYTLKCIGDATLTYNVVSILFIMNGNIDCINLYSYFPYSSQQLLLELSLDRQPPDCSLLPVPPTRS